MLLAIIRQALYTMRLHWLWAALTISGILWGTASVVLLVGWGIGVHGMVDEGMQRVGKNLVFISAGRIGENLSPAEERRTLKLELADVSAYREAARRISACSAEIMEFMFVEQGSTSHVVDVRGVEPQMREIRNVRVESGRFISADDQTLVRRVAVIGQTARERLFAHKPPIDQSIYIDGQRFQVIGLLKRVGIQLSRDRSLIDEQIWIPVTAAKEMTGRKDINLIAANAIDRRYNEEVKLEARRILAKRLHVSPNDEEAVFIVSLIDYLTGFDAVFAALSVFLIIVTIATLMIGGIGVMNMMLVSVNERRSEIGLRLAVGATRADVLSQFLAETLTITLLGGIVGTSIGMLGCVALAQIHGDLVPIPTIEPRVVALSIVSTIIIGIVSGTVPAWRAASIDPAETLRAE